MSYTCEEYLNRVLEGYKASYDIFRLEEDSIPEGLPLAATAEMHMTETSYVISKKAEMWSANTHEYAYFFQVPHLDAVTAEKCIAYAYEAGMSKINEEYLKNHMCTRIAANFICDEVEPDAVKRIKQCKIYKNFQFSLKGWMEFHAVSVDLGKESVEANRYGAATAKFMQNVLKPAGRKKGRRIWSIIRQMLD